MTNADKNYARTNASTALPASRRAVLKSLAGMTLLGAAAVAGGAGCEKKSKASAGVQTSSGHGPEVTKLKLGMIALTDCSPLVIAEKKGLFKKYGVEGIVDKKANWAAIRDTLNSGEIQGTHMLLGMPVASTMGIGGNKVPLVIPWILNRNGQSITLAKALKGKVQADAAALKLIVDAAKAAGKPMSFAMTFPTGTHAMWIRYWLAAGGINPDTDAGLKVVPPPNMYSNMQAGEMNGFCVGEPWNAKCVAEGVGYTAINTQDIWKDHPEKVLAFKADFAEKNPKTVKAVLKAVHEASVWLDDLNNRPEQCDLISPTGYVNCDKNLILGRLKGEYDFGDERGKKQDPNYMIFSQRNCNYPQLKYATWFMSQYRRWGLVEGTPDYAGIAKQVMRTDIYEEAMKEINYAHGGANSSPETLFDGVTFDPAKPEEYAKSFKVHSMKG
ncbi:MAG TPA: CmpA/NrtA family ABC transporter substrate-binding protein [Tepidisphaeraceae bacterium]|nr:CmpA/NrtA family ABC transporter substrate-binding protein [Tepidisphaeraceae bacterium]